MRNKIIGYCFIAALLSLSFGKDQGLAFAQQSTGTVYGKITDKEGRPIADAKISALLSPSAKGASKFTTSSTENGDYELIVPADTAVTIEFSHVSFGIRLKTVKVVKGQREKIIILVDDAHSLDTVVIEDKTARANFIQSIPTKDIYVQSGASGDFNVILFTQLGVQQSNELSSSYSVRHRGLPPFSRP
jgi:Carboxypeptidase regulatory-like domain